MDVGVFCCLSYIYMFGLLRRAICPVVSTSMLGVSHAVQNEKKLWKFTQSDEVRISARSTGVGCIRFHTAVIGGPSMTKSTRDNLRAKYAVIYDLLATLANLQAACEKEKSPGTSTITTEEVDCGENGTQQASLMRSPPPPSRLIATPRRSPSGRSDFASVLVESAPAC